MRTWLNWDQPAEFPEQVMGKSRIRSESQSFGSMCNASAAPSSSPRAMTVLANNKATASPEANSRRTRCRTTST